MPHIVVPLQQFCINQSFSNGKIVVQTQGIETARSQGLGIDGLLYKVIFVIGSGGIRRIWVNGQAVVERCKGRVLCGHNAR